jgi:hypothetical protein
MQGDKKLVFPKLVPPYLSRKIFSSSNSNIIIPKIKISKNKTSRKFNIIIPTISDEELIAEIEQFINTRDSVVMHNHDNRGFVYGVLSQLNPEK